MSSYVNRNRTVKQGGRIRRKGEKKRWREGRKKGRGKTERQNSLILENPDCVWNSGNHNSYSLC